MKKGIATKSQSDCFQRNHFFGCNITKVYVSSKQLNKPNLLGFLGSFPNDFFEGYFSKNFLDQSRPDFSRLAE